MRILLYTLILLLLLYAPVKRLDVAKLEPVEIVCMDADAGEILLSTDTEAWGRGEETASALADMQDRTPGVIYLDTAEFLLVTPAAISQIESLRPYLKESVRICGTDDTDLSGMAKFLEIHGALPTLKVWETGDSLPTINDGKIIE